jgi:hypothetical protein
MKPVCYLMLLYCSSVCVADTSVWVVSKGERQLFIGGTIHLLSKNDFPLPDEYDQAYEGSSNLVFETDIAAAASAFLQPTVQQQLVYLSDQTLQDDLGEEAYAALRDYCASRGIPMSVIDRLRPPMAAMTLTLFELKRIGVDAAGVDQHFYARAQADSKVIDYFETPDEQLRFIVNMGKGNEDALVMNMVADMSRLESMMSAMKAAWRAGDQLQLAQVAIEPLRSDYPDLYETMLVQRNVAWLSGIEEMLETPEVEFVLVGAAHLAGEHGILRQLQQRGYRIRPF